MIETQFCVGNDDWTVAVDFLAEKLQLSRSKVRDLMNKGGIWQQHKSGTKRLRRANSKLKTGDVLLVNYDPARLATTVKDIDFIADFDLYSIWYKPAMMALHGDKWADFDSFGRNVELACHGEREIILFENLNAIESGALLVAHSRRAAALLANKIASGELSWQLRGEVIGKLDNCELAGSRIKVIGYDENRDCSKLEITCRALVAVDAAQFVKVAYKLREALAAAGHAVLGDPEFSNDDHAQLKLRVVDIVIA